GYNSRLDEIQAAILRVLLPRLGAWSQARRTAARAYEDGGLGDHVGLPAPQPAAEPAWHLYVVTHPEPDRLRQTLAKQGIEARGYYRTPVHRQAAAARFAAAGARLPATEELA